MLPWDCYFSHFLMWLTNNWKWFRCSDKFQNILDFLLEQVLNLTWVFELLLSEFRSDRDLAYASSFSASVFPPEKIIKVMSVHVQGGRKPDYLTLLMVNWNASALQNNCSRFEHGNIFIVRQMILTGDVIMFFRTLLLTKLINLRLFILERPIRARKFCDIVCWEKSGKFKF